MAIKRALVVDDSRSARIALKKLLEEHQLDVALAESGEDAIDYLKKDNVDVIFMDHTMPGMDGLEAVSAIKANPKTATIPVMMYTTKEGEVYVGQARALGAVGVLPKNVQPHQLFEMLLHLGLVTERRSVAREPELPEVNLDDVMEGVDRELDEQALGISVQSLVSRILDDQHATLRADILRSHKSFAREVAHEVLKQQALTEDAVQENSADEVDEFADSEPKRSRLLAGVAVVSVVVAAFLAWQFKIERDAAIDQLVVVESNRTIVDDQQIVSLKNELSGVQEQSESRLDGALDGFAWAVNGQTQTDMYAPAYSEELAERMRNLLPHVEKLRFDGQVELVSHLGRFCLVVDELGNYQLAPDELPMLSCDYVGHVLENNDYVSDRLSVGFSSLIRERQFNAAQFNSSRQSELALVALDAQASTTVVPYPDSAASAGEWNEIARQNNRVEVRFVSGLDTVQNQVAQP